MANGGVWVTVNGTHIFIKDSETFDEAMDRMKEYEKNHINLKNYIDESEKKYIESKNTYVNGGWGMRKTFESALKEKGISDETIQYMQSLFDRHSGTEAQQKSADSEIEKAFNSNTELGKALRFRSELETQAYNMWLKTHKDSEQLSNGSLILYRGGDRKNVEPWSVDSNNKFYEQQTSLRKRHIKTVKDLEKEGYRILGGFGNKVGASGEGEILMIKVNL